MSIIQADDTQVNPATEADPSTWPAWTDNWHYETNDDTEADLAAAWDLPIEANDDDDQADDEATAREHLDASGRLTLAELVERQSAFYGSWGNDAGRMLEAHMTELALKVRLTGSATPAEYEARIAILDAEARDQWEAIGYEQGRASVACEPEPGPAFGHMA